MSAPRISLRRPAGQPAGHTYRIAAVVSFLTLAWIWLLAELLPPVYPDDDCGSANCPPPPALEHSGAPPDLELFLATIGVELAIIACYLTVAVARGKLDRRAALRTSPTAAAIVVLAVGGFGWLFDAGGDLDSLSSVGLGYLVLFACWLFAPVVLYDVYRGDRGAVRLVVIGLAPTAVANALFLTVRSAVPAAMLVIAVITVVVVHLRRR